MSFILTNKSKWLMEADHCDLEQTRVYATYASRQEALEKNPEVFDLTTQNTNMCDDTTSEGQKLNDPTKVKLSLCGKWELTTHIEDQAQNHQWYKHQRHLEFGSLTSKK